MADARPLQVDGYAGPRRCLLVVDNEEDDRQLLQRWLAPLGFEVHLAACGEQALALLEAGLRPDAVFMDLAMPGMDGWQTLQRIQALAQGQGWPAPAWAVVSANAFDKGLDNPVGLHADDFFVKPVRRDDLLRWLARRLELTWLPSAAAPTAAQSVNMPSSDEACWADLRALSATDLRGLIASARLGHYRGLVRCLDELCPGPAGDRLRVWAREFRFEQIEQVLQEALGALEPSRD